VRNARMAGSPEDSFQAADGPIQKERLGIVRAHDGCESKFKCN
jgi:hypothetical protein